MTTDSFFNIDFEEPTPELELSVELKCREVIKNQNIDEVKKHCINLIRHQMRQDIFLANMLGRVAELEASLNKNLPNKGEKRYKKPPKK